MNGEKVNDLAFDIIPGWSANRERLAVCGAHAQMGLLLCGDLRVTRSPSAERQQARPQRPSCCQETGKAGVGASRVDFHERRVEGHWVTRRRVVRCRSVAWREAWCSNGAQSASACPPPQPVWWRGVVKVVKVRNSDIHFCSVYV